MYASITKPIRVYLKGPEQSSTNRRLLRFIEKNFPSDFSVNFSNSVETFLAVLQHQVVSDGGTAVVCGGDGMAHYAIQLVAGASTVLLPLPGGTANDLSRELGWCPLPRGTSVTECRRIDCLRVNGRLVATVGGCGVGAEVIRRVKAVNGYRPEAWIRSAVLGRWIYALGSAETALRRVPLKAKYVVEHDGGCWKGITSSILVCNQGTLAGTFSLCKSSKNRDGLFEIVVSKQASTAESMVDGLQSILFGKPMADSSAHVVSTTSARIITPLGPDHRFFADGELLPRSPDGEYRISMEPGILKVIRRP
jgi:diacylglycerol kinase (ATP)